MHERRVLLTYKGLTSVFWMMLVLFGLRLQHYTTTRWGGVSLV